MNYHRLEAVPWLPWLSKSPTLRVGPNRRLFPGNISLQLAGFRRERFQFPQESEVVNRAVGLYVRVGSHRLFVHVHGVVV